MEIRRARENDYSSILSLWERSVIATHHFLKAEDLQDIKKEIPLYLPVLDVRLWYSEDSFIGFSATNHHHLEMLFLDPDKTRKGFGTAILTRLIRDFGVTSVDVNKDNENAKRFYLKHGFSIFGEDLTDSAGRPYPILHLKL